MTPFDTALRVQRREVDSLRISISVAVERLSHLERSHRENIDIARRERASTNEIWVPTDAWAARMRAERTRLLRDARDAEARLAQLRSQATELYGTMRAIEQAADTYRAESERTAATAEQTGLDDVVAARLVRNRLRPGDVR